MSSPDTTTTDWFRIVSACATGDLPVKRVWMDPAELSARAGSLICDEDGDWLIEHVGRAIGKRTASPRHPVYLRAICNPVDLPPCRDFDGNPIPDPADNPQARHRR